MSDSRLSDDHVIRVYHVQNEPSCRVRCFLEPDCVAYNYGKNFEGNLRCELCNKSHLQVPTNHVMVTLGFIFRPVAKVLCVFLFPQYLLTFSEEDYFLLFQVIVKYLCLVNVEVEWKCMYCNNSRDECKQ